MHHNNKLFGISVRWQCGQVVREPDLKSSNPDFKSHTDHQLDLFQVVLGSTPRLGLYKANWSASCQLGFLTCSLHSLYFQPKMQSIGFTSNRVSQKMIIITVDFAYVSYRFKVPVFPSSTFFFIILTLYNLFVMQSSEETFQKYQVNPLILHHWKTTFTFLFRDFCNSLTIINFEKHAQ